MKAALALSAMALVVAVAFIPVLSPVSPVLVYPIRPWRYPHEAPVRMEPVQAQVVGEPCTERVGPARDDAVRSYCCCCCDDDDIP